MDVQNPALVFPVTFCCNCGDPNCANEVQDTRITRFFGIGGSETTFHLPIPVCAACRRTTRRRPAGFFGRLFVLVLSIGVLFVSLLFLSSHVQVPLWINLHSFAISVALGFILTIVFYRLRRPTPPRTSFYQPVRIKSADVQITGPMAGGGHVVYMKLAFTNPEYLALFADANRDAIQSGHLAAVRA